MSRADDDKVTTAGQQAEPDDRPNVLGTMQRLLERIGAGSPAGQEDAATDADTPAGPPQPPPAPDVSGATHTGQCPDLSGAAMPGGRPALGIDIGSSSMKLVCLQHSPLGVEVVDASVTPLAAEPGAGRFGQIGRSLRSFIARQSSKPRRASYAFSGEGAATLCCSLPRMEEADLSQALHWKLAEEDSVDIERSTVAHHTLGGPGANGEQEFVAAAVPDTLDRIDTLFPGQRPRLSVVVTEPLAVESLILAACPRRGGGATAVLDVGNRSSRLSVISGQGLRFTRAIPVGGEAVTEALVGRITLESETVEVGREQAEQLKREYAIGQDEPVEVGGVAVPASRVLGAIRPALERLASEAVRSMQFFSQTHGMTKVERLMVCGGGAALGGLAEYLSREIHMPAARLDPWRILDFEVSDEIEASPALFAAATGAAIHDGARINLLPPRLRARRMISMVRTGSIAATGFILAALLGLSWVAGQQSAELQKVVAEKRSAADPMEAMAEQIEEAKQRRAELERRKQILRSMGIGRPVHAAVLKELSNILPPGSYLRSLSFDKAEGVCKMRLVVDVYAMPSAPSRRLKQDLISALERSPFFVNVSFVPAPGKPDGPMRAPDEQLVLTCQVLGVLGE
ncbi:MAG: pilus assembly protein PilM [Planctomycetota bacterium]